MYAAMLHSHSIIRYFILILLVIVVVKSVLGWLSNKPYTNFDNKLSLYLVIFTHLQLVAGLVLYFISPSVQFNDQTMSNDQIRMWTVEHVTMMLVAIVLITVARSTSKRMSTDVGRHRRMAVFNIIALVIIVGAIVMSGRGLIGQY